MCSSGGGVAALFSARDNRRFGTDEHPDHEHSGEAMPPPDVGPQPPTPPKPRPGARPVTVQDLERFDFAALEKLIRVLKARDQLTVNQAKLLGKAQDALLRKIGLAPPGLDVDPALIPLRPPPPDPGPDAAYLDRVLRGDLDTGPSSFLASVFEALFIGKNPARVLSQLNPFGSRANSGGDVLTPDQLRALLPHLTDAQRANLFTMLRIAQEIQEGQSGVVPMDKRDP